MTDGPLFPSAIRTLHTGRLLLTPTDPEALVPIDLLRGTLTGLGLLGAPRPGEPLAFAPGEGLWQLIGFSGCAVQLPVAGDGEIRLHLRLYGPYDAPVLRHGRNSRPPRCPACGRPLADWRRLVDAAQDAPAPSLVCADCGATAPAWRWHWGTRAGCGRVFVSCEEVFPGEGQPLPRLLQVLADLGIGPWRHFHIQD